MRTVSKVQQKRIKQHLKDLDRKLDISGRLDAAFLTDARRDLSDMYREEHIDLWRSWERFIEHVQAGAFSDTVSAIRLPQEPCMVFRHKHPKCLRDTCWRRVRAGGLCVVCRHHAKISLARQPPK